MSKTETTGTVEKCDKFPPGIPYIVGNEAAERFSYYGMRQILYIYLVALFIGFVAEDAVAPAMVEAAQIKATQWTHLFMAGVYLFPMIGAILADRFLGKFKVILWLSLVYVAGHAVLAVGGRFAALGDLSGAEAAMIAGLVLIAVGSGGVKPCVSANVGDQFTSKNSHLLTKVFQIFYFSINFGSFFASLLTPWLYKKYGAEVAFGVPGVLMALATLIFWLGRKKFVKVPANPGGKLGAIDFSASTLLMVPLLLGIYVALEKSEVLVHAATEEGFIALVEASTEVALHFWWVAVVGLFALIVGLTISHFRQKLQEDTGFLAMIIYGFKNRKSQQKFWAPVREKYGDEAAEGPQAVMRIMVVFSMVSVFWALFDQHSSTWIAQAKLMNLTLVVPSALWTGGMYATIFAAFAGAVLLFMWVSNISISKKFYWGVGSVTLGILIVFGIAQLIIPLEAEGGLMGGLHGFVTHYYPNTMLSIDLLPAQIAALNPLLVMIIIPLLNALVYQPLEKAGKPLKPLRRMTIGMFMASFAFVAVALIQARIGSLEAGGEKIHVLWQLIPYIVMTTAEVLVSITGLEFAYTQAPRAMKSTIMGFWLLCVTFGNVLVAFLAPLQSLSLTTFFWVFAGLMAVAALVFAILASFYKEKTYIQN